MKTICVTFLIFIASVGQREPREASGSEYESSSLTHTELKKRNTQKSCTHFIQRVIHFKRIILTY